MGSVIILNLSYSLSDHGLSYGFYRDHRRGFTLFFFKAVFSFRFVFLKCLDILLLSGPVFPDTQFFLSTSYFFLQDRLFFVALLNFTSPYCSHELVCFASLFIRWEESFNGAFGIFLTLLDVVCDSF